MHPCALAGQGPLLDKQIISTVVIDEVDLFGLYDDACRFGSITFSAVEPESATWPLGELRMMTPRVADGLWLRRVTESDLVYDTASWISLRDDRYWTWLHAFVSVCDLDLPDTDQIVSDIAGRRRRARRAMVDALYVAIFTTNTRWERSEDVERRRRGRRCVRRRAACAEFLVDRRFFRRERTSG